MRAVHARLRRQRRRSFAAEMSAPVCAFLLTLSTLCGSRVVSGVLSRPTNVRWTSYNMDLVLRWDPPEGADGGLVYTAEYRLSLGQLDPFKSICVNITSLECDFTRSGARIMEFGKYTGRVRAQLGGESSGWVESKEIILDNETIIGRPNVTLVPAGDTIEVVIKDPVFHISSLRELYSPKYNITYWRDDQKEKARSISDIQQNRITLSDLDVWTKYCIQVQIYTRNPNPSEPSRIVCEETTKVGAPWVAAVVMFVAVAVAVALVVLAVVYRKTISDFLCPKDVIPEHFKEDLLARPNSSMYVTMQNSHPPEEIYHPVSIVADDRTVEEGRPLEAAEVHCSTQPDHTVGER